MRKHRRLHDAYRFPGFRPASTVRGIFGDPKARILRLKRRGEKLCAVSVERFTAPSTTTGTAWFGISPAGTPGCTWRSPSGGSCANGAGRRCRASSIQDIARELRLDWHTVKELEKQYMREQLRRAGTPGPKIIGIDEVSIKKGHTYRIVGNHLGPERPIRFG